MDICIHNQSKAEQFGLLFQHIKLFTEHINIMFEKHEFYVQCMDSGRVSIMEIKIPSEWFDVYTHKQDACITIGINSSLLFKILNAREKDQILHMEFRDSDVDRLYVHFTSNEKALTKKVENKNFDKYFEIPLIEVDTEIMSIPDIEHQAEITISSYHFANVINQLKMFGDTMEINCSEDKIMLISKSHDQGKMFVEIKIDDISSFVIDEGVNLELSYSLQYLHNICLYNKMTREMDLKFSSNFPMQIIYSLGENARMLFYLAPKINDEE